MTGLFPGSIAAVVPFLLEKSFYFDILSIRGAISARCVADPSTYTQIERLVAATFRLHRLARTYKVAVIAG